MLIIDTLAFTYICLSRWLIFNGHLYLSVWIGAHGYDQGKASLIHAITVGCVCVCVGGG